jgi:hypothetical protein
MAVHALPAFGIEPPPVHAPARHGLHYRQQIRVLDQGLERLEQAHERGEVAVSEDLAYEFAGSVPGVRAGMQITDALELIFNRQAECLHGLPAFVDAPRPGDGSGMQVMHRSGAVAITGRGAPSERLIRLANETSATTDGITRSEAESLTERIRCSVHLVSTLLLEAHSRRAWVALGYPTWERYTRVEFGISRSRSYELLDHGHVLIEVMRVAHVTDPPAVSVRSAQQVRHAIPVLLAAVAERTKGLTAERAKEIIPAIVREIAESRAARGTDHGGMNARVADFPVGGEARTSVALSRLVAAIDYLASMPDAQTTAHRMPSGARRRLGRLPVAMRWLAEFSSSLPQLEDPQPDLSGAYPQ